MCVLLGVSLCVVFSGISVLESLCCCSSDRFSVKWVVVSWGLWCISVLSSVCVLGLWVGCRWIRLVRFKLDVVKFGVSDSVLWNVVLVCVGWLWLVYRVLRLF